MGTMDFSEKESLPDQTNENKKCCSDCRTTRTPLWRGGPAGPKSLCNACGIRYRKKMVPVVGLRKGTERKKERSHGHDHTDSSGGGTAITTSSASKTIKNDRNGGQNDKGFSQTTLKVRLIALGKEMLTHRLSSPSLVKKQRCRSRRKKLGEEEQAAFLLMALSCGSVFA
ncbi:GATA transcription factor 16-like [Humulus lupulus]|uniref:GATA transcription factor 16-like n=1 Tax=Humulus lupulus TaxID=3486 RepID=UPI002B40B28B|nr:GATA transcription factor 16-like [Humulus lupulus]